MSFTNGFLRLTRDELSLLRQDANAFEQRCRNYDDPDYLDMDRAGAELQFILDPASVDFDNPEAKSSFPAIADVLGGGTVIHDNIDLGFGPARIVSDESMRQSLAEIDRLRFEDLYTMASTELMSEVLICETDENMVREYHWAYLQTLAKFIAEAVSRDMALLRY